MATPPSPTAPHFGGFGRLEISTQSAVDLADAVEGNWPVGAPKAQVQNAVHGTNVAALVRDVEANPLIAVSNRDHALTVGGIVAGWNARGGEVEAVRNAAAATIPKEKQRAGRWGFVKGAAVFAPLMLIAGGVGALYATNQWDARSERKEERAYAAQKHSDEGVVYLSYRLPKGKENMRDEVTQDVEKVAIVAHHYRGSGCYYVSTKDVSEDIGGFQFVVQPGSAAEKALIDKPQFVVTRADGAKRIESAKPNERLSLPTLSSFEQTAAIQLPGLTKVDCSRTPPAKPAKSKSKKSKEGKSK